MTPITEFPQPIRTFRGHLNEKNFVGLCSDTEDMLVTGSESGFVYLYYKYMPRPILRFNFNTLETLNGTSDQVLSSEVSFANASATRAAYSRALPTTPLSIGQQLTFPDSVVVGQPSADAANTSLAAGDLALDRSGDPASLLGFGAPSRGLPSSLGGAARSTTLLAGLGILSTSRIAGLSFQNFAWTTSAAAPPPSNPSNPSEFFISGIAWKLGSNVIAAANSLGIVRVSHFSKLDFCFNNCKQSVSRCLYYIHYNMYFIFIIDRFWSYRKNGRLLHPDNFRLGLYSRDIQPARLVMLFCFL